MKAALEQIFDASLEAMEAAPEIKHPTVLIVGHRVWDELLPGLDKQGLRMRLALPHGPVDVFPDRYCPDGHWHLTVDSIHLDDCRGAFYRHGSIDPPETLSLRDPYFHVEERP